MEKKVETEAILQKPGLLTTFRREGCNLHT
jgi:hypothetical protein